MPQNRGMTSAVASRTARGFLFALAAGLVFQCLNVAVKALVLELPPMQAAWMRWISGILFITPFALAAGPGAIHTRDIKLHGLRSIFHSSGYALWYSGVGLIPLATTAALSFTGPLFVTLGAALVLGERVHGARWMGVLAGFVGVLVILQPGLAEPNPGALIVLAAVPLIAGSNLVAKVAAGRDTPVLVVFWQTMFAAVLFAPFGLWFWQQTSAAHWALALGAGFFGTLGYFLITWAFRLLDISAVQPIAFLSIVWASLFDILIFGKTADAWTFVGATIVVAASTAIVHLEARRGAV
jgi:drug/metabolite transporter (DMT)-like permease